MNIPKGKLGEEVAAKYLRQRDYRIIEQNYYGKYGEIDIIAEKDNELIFIEVKTRFNIKFGYPEESFNKKKRISLIKTIQKYLFLKNLEMDYRIDLIAVIINIKGQKVQIKHFENVIIDI
ncbi:MAG TPA: YraN family protein [Patescibacteria group bacterium]